MTREPAEPMRLDYLIKAGTIHTMTGDTYRSVGLRGPEIAAVSPEPDGLDDLAGPGTIHADLVACPIDPLTADLDDLADLRPALTLVGGRATQDPDKRLAR